MPELPKGDSTQILHSIPRPIFISYARRDFRIAYRVAWECIITDEEKQRHLKNKGKEGGLWEVLTLDVPPPHLLPPDMKLDWMHFVSSTSDHWAAPPGAPGYEDDWHPGMPGWMFGIGGEMIRAKSMVVIVTLHSGASHAVAKEIEAFSVFPDKPSWLVSVNNTPAPSKFFELPNLHTAVANINMDAIFRGILQSAADFEAQQEWLKARRLYFEAIDLAALREVYDQFEAMQMVVRKGRMEINLGWRQRAIQSFERALDKLEEDRYAERTVLLYNLGQAHLADAHDEGLQGWSPKILTATHAAWAAALETLNEQVQMLSQLKWFDQARIRSHVETGLEWLNAIEERVNRPKDATVSQNKIEDPLARYADAAEAGDADAQFHLGRAYMGGSGIKRDDVKAAKHLLAAAEQGHAAAQFWVGFGYETELGFLRIDTKAVDWHTKAAEQGFALAQYRLGKMIADGRGTEQNHTVAAEWFRKAAAQGHAGAQKELGIFYREGLGCKQDIDEAIRWLGKAAEQEILSAQILLGAINRSGLGIEANVAQAEVWYRRAALRGNAAAQNELGVIYQDRPGREEDAVRWYTRAALQQYTEAEFNLGWLYQIGHGVDKDPDMAAHWYHRAAQRDHISAMTNLGFLYRTGSGVALDFSKAASWYQKAAEQGDAIAQWSLGMLYLQGNGVEQSNTEAARWMHEAAQQGHSHAQNTLGEMYADGVGVDRSDAESLHWFRLAAEQGNARGQYNLGLSYGQGRGVERNEKEGVRWLQRAARQQHEPAIEMLAKLGVARIADPSSALHSPDEKLAGKHFLWILDRFVSRMEDSRGLRGQVCVGLRTTENQYLIWQAIFGDRIKTEFLVEWPENADATLFIGEADALSVLHGTGIPEQPTLLMIDGDRQLISDLFGLFQAQV